MFKKWFGSDKQSVQTSNATLNSLRNTIDGYIGYDDVSNRSKTDKAIRQYWLDQILRIIDQYSKVQNQLMQGQLLSTWPASNAIIKMLEDLRVFLQKDVYRHSTFFETPNISESLDIEVIYVVETETILEMRDIISFIDVVLEKLSALELLDIEKDIFRIKEMVEEVKTTITDRAELIASFELVGL